jgi:hypothetical protein
VDKGKPPPWTDDPILSTYRFCNIFREDDKVTTWLRENVREQLPHEQLLAATVLFRWFNRIEIGEVLFCQLGLLNKGRTPWQQYWDEDCDDPMILRNAIKQAFPKGPYVTGAYIIKGQDGMPKLDGVLHSFQQFIEGEAVPGDDDQPVDWRQMTQTMKDYPGEVYMEYTWDWLRRFNYLGPFMAYEIVTDLQHTLDMLHRAPDVMTWANPGPGAMRGLNRIAGRELRSRSGKREMLHEMQALLAASRFKKNWPWQDRPWDMRTVEHTLCEFDKYQRAMLGQGRPRQKMGA